MKIHLHLVRALPLLLAATFLLTAPARAQYIYLDSNGDGVHTSADVLHGSGPTVVDIWLDTAHNRDGSPTTCVLEPETPLTIFSYAVDLSAVGGHVGYASYTNRVAEMGPVGFAYPADSVNYSTGAFFTPTSLVLPAGKYHLGTLILYAGSGTPSIQIVPGRDLTVFFDMTEFGSICPGYEFANTIALGSDFFDADGLAYSPGGGPSQGPSLAPPSDMTVRSGENGLQTLTAGDADGQPLSFSKLSGPHFLTVNTTEQGAGTARGEIRVAPFLSDVGSAGAAVKVSDGVASDQATFGVTITQGPDHPPFAPRPAAMTVAAGLISRLYLNAGDPDGGAVHFARVAGPAYADMRELSGHPGGGSAVMTLRPSICDVGTATFTFSVTDGVGAVERSVGVSVVPAIPDTTVRHNTAGFVNALTLADLNGDGKLDLLAAHEDLSLVSYYRGTGTGDFIFTTAFDVSGQDGGLATGDFDGDGHLDLAVTNPAQATVDVLLGVGDGTLHPPRRYATGTGPSSISVSDFNRDGRLDLVTNNQEAGTVSVLLGLGDGTFGPRHDARVGFRPNAMAIGDFNLDGRPDVALAGVVNDVIQGVLTVLPGLGDGSFGDGMATHFTGYPFTLVSGDWDQDGRTDLALTNISGPGTVQTFRGHGDGSFDPGLVVVNADPLSVLFNMVAGDMDGDGNLDLVVSDIQFARLILARGDGHGSFGTPTFLRNRYAAGLAIGDVNQDGRPDLAGSGPLRVDVFMNPFIPPGSVDAIAFVDGGKRPVAARGEDLCVRLQASDPDPSGQGRSPKDQLLIDPTSVLLRSEGTGSVSEIHALVRKVTVVTDGQNGKTELGVCFAAQDVAALFDGLTHPTRVTPKLTGALLDGRGFCAPLELIEGGGPAPKAAVVFAPNPLNPVTRLSFTTLRDGPASVAIFDIHGRSIRTLLDVPRLPAGSHEYRFDGKGDRGETLPSGVYFYRVMTTEGHFDGQFARCSRPERF